MHKGALHKSLILAVAAFSAACTLSRTPAPPLQGPSELGLSLSTFANPDTLSQDGASQSQVAIQAFDSNGQPAKNVPFRAEILVNGTVTDFGSLSARTLVTGNDGRAAVTYTAPAPPLVSVDTGASVSIRLTPSAGDLSNSQGRLVSIRLVPPGVILGGSSPAAVFTYAPANPEAFAATTFDGSTSRVGTGGPIISYSWDFGDGSKGTGPVAIHQFTASGTYIVSLTVMDNSGVTNTAAQAVLVLVGQLPSAAFTISPSAGAVTNQAIFFNGSHSLPGNGRKIVRWDWDFGTGATGSGENIQKSYDTAGVYVVVLTVTDDVGQKGKAQASVSITSNPNSAVSARYTFSPSPAQTNQPVTFDGSSSATTTGNIIRYEWNFNDGSNPITSSTSPTIQHTFTQQAGPGGYTVTLTVFDSNGNSNSVSHQVVVQ